MRRWPVGTSLLIAVLLLAGCQSPVDRLNAYIRTKTRKVTPVAQVQTDLGLLTLYRVTSWHQCGQGYRLTGGDGAESVSDCDPGAPLTRMEVQTSNHVMRMGAVQDPAIRQVNLIFDDGRKVPAQVVGGVWYLLLPGNQQSHPTVEGLDEGGNRVYPKGK